MESLPQEDGIYIYQNGAYERLKIEGPFVPERDGTYIIYFRNKRCPGCKAFDRKWNIFVKRFRTDFGSLAIVQCTNFFHECGDQAAADTFIFYLVFATPQIIVVIIENGVPVYVERELYFDSVESLENFVYGVHERRKQLESQPGEELEEGEGIYIDLSKKNWREIVEQIKKLVIEGKSLKEVCTESGCKLVVE